MPLLLSSGQPSTQLPALPQNKRKTVAGKPYRWSPCPSPLPPFHISPVRLSLTLSLSRSLPLSLPPAALLCPCHSISTTSAVFPSASVPSEAIFDTSGHLHSAQLNWLQPILTSLPRNPFISPCAAPLNFPRAGYSPPSSGTDITAAAPMLPPASTL